MLQKSLSVLFVLLFGMGCVGSPSYPDWFSKTPHDTAQYIYGARDGATKEEAISNSLNAIASKIRVSVESTSSIRTNIRIDNEDEEYSKDLTQTIKNNVQKIEFSNYIVKKEEKLSDEKYAVLVQVDKALNAKLLLTKIDTDIAKYNQLLATNHKNPIATVKTYNQSIKQIKNRNLIDCSTVKNFMPNSNVNEKINQLLEIEKKMTQYQGNIIFAIKGDNSAYQDVLTKQITEKGFRTSGGSSSITISMKVNETKLKVLGNNILKSSIQLTVESGGTVIGQSRIMVGAKSRTGYDQARDFTLQKFEARLRDKKIIENLLGI
jgi:hypothetical protein